MNKCWKQRWITIWVMKNTPIKEIIVATPAMVVIGSRFKPRWVNLLFRFLVIGKVNLSLLSFPSINPAAYLSSVLSSLFMPKV